MGGEGVGSLSVVRGSPSLPKALPRRPSQQCWFAKVCKPTLLSGAVRGALHNSVGLQTNTVVRGSPSLPGAARASQKRSRGALHNIAGLQKFANQHCCQGQSEAPFTTVLVCKPTLLSGAARRSQDPISLLVSMVSNCGESQESRVPKAVAPEIFSQTTLAGKSTSPRAPAQLRTHARTHERTNETNPISRLDSPPNLRL